MDDTDARSIMAAVNAACGDRRRPLLVDLTGVTAVSRGARWVFAVRSRVARAALFGPRPVERVIAIFFTRLHAMPCPTAVFTRLAPAIQWLRAADHTPEESRAGNSTRAGL